MKSVEWLSWESVAIRLDLTKKDGRPDGPRFRRFLSQSPAAKPLREHTYRLGGRNRFRAVDVDRCIEATAPRREPEA
jgi:hypothetical protein